MEGELLWTLYRITQRLAQPRRKREQYSDAVICLIFLWAVLNDRPMSWACQQRHAPPNWDSPLPSAACLSRRLRTVALQQLLERLAQEIDMLEQVGMLMLLLIDSKPLVVGVYSKDRSAKWGHVGEGRKARGYRIHLIATPQGKIVTWMLASMNEADSVVARRLVAKLWAQGYLVGDSAYDSNPLHALCAERGLRLIAPRKKPGTGLGSRRHENSRVQAIQLLELPTGTASRFGRELYQQRGQIERLLGQWTSCAGGLSLSLPSWVRTPRRVANWVAGKMIIRCVRNHATAA